MRQPALLAALALLAAGCPSEPLRGAASVSVIDWYGPVVGADVVFHNPDGTVLAHLLTDASGQATAEVEAGALVTAARFQAGSTDEWRLTTIAGVEPGDALVLEPPPESGWGGSVVGSASVSYPGTLAGTDQYSVTLGCTGTGWAYTPDPFTVQLISGCGSSLDAIGIAHSASTGLVGWATATAVPITGTPPDMTASVNLGSWRTDLGTLEVTLSNPPASAVGVAGYLVPRRGEKLWYGATVGKGGSVAPPASVSIPFARDFWSSGRLELTLWHGYDTTTFIANQSALADRAVDLATAMPPRLSGLTLTETATGYEASWTRSAADAGLDGTVLVAAWVDGTGIHRWRVALPPCCTRFAFPELPAALAAWLPAPATPLDSVLVNAHDLSTVSSYRSFRNEHLLFVEEAIPEAGDWTLRSSQTITVP